MTANKQYERPYCSVCFCCAMPLMVISLILFLISVQNQDSISDAIKDIGGSWSKDQVFAISSAPNPPLGADQYMDKWVGYYPGTTEGCFCSQSNYYRRIQAGLKDRSCNLNESWYGGCSKINPTQPVTLSKFIEGQEVYAVRTKGTSFKENYDKMKSDGSCASGYKNCGNKDSKSKGFCIKESIQGCPLTDLSSNLKPGYNMVGFNGFVIYTSNSAGINNPITDLNITEDHLCQMKKFFPVTPDRQRYRLLKGYSGSCYKDENAISLGEIGETELFDLNGVDYKNLIQFQTSNDFKYKLFAARLVEWSPDCKDMVVEVGNKSNDAQTLQDSFSTVKIVYIIVTIISLFLFFRFVCVESGPIKVYYLLFALRLILFIILISLIFNLNTKIKGIESYLDDISSKNCSSTETNANFKDLSIKFSEKVSVYTKWYIITSIAGFFFEIVMLLIVIIMGKSEERQLENGYGPTGGNEMGKYQPMSSPGYNPYNENQSPYTQGGVGYNGNMGYR